MKSPCILVGSPCIKSKSTFLISWINSELIWPFTHQLWEILKNFTYVKFWITLYFVGSPCIKSKTTFLTSCINSELIWPLKHQIWAVLKKKLFFSGLMNHPVFLSDHPVSSSKLLFWHPVLILNWFDPSNTKFEQFWKIFIFCEILNHPVFLLDHPVSSQKLLFWHPVLILNWFDPSNAKFEPFWKMCFFCEILNHPVFRWVTLYFLVNTLFGTL